MDPKYIPEELIFQFCSFLPNECLAKMAQTNRFLNTLVQPLFDYSANNGYALVYSLKDIHRVNYVLLRKCVFHPKIDLSVYCFGALNCLLEKISKYVLNHYSMSNEDLEILEQMSIWFKTHSSKFIHMFEQVSGFISLQSARNKLRYCHQLFQKPTFVELFGVYTLTCMCEDGSVDSEFVINYLNKNPQIVINDEDPLLRIATRNFDKKLLQRIFTQQGFTFNADSLIFFDAIRQGHIDLVWFFLEDKIIDPTSRNGLSLIEAATLKNPTILNILLKDTRMDRCVCSFGHNALKRAIEENNNVAAVILKEDIRVNTTMEQ
jgi:hypothetical protein